MTQNTGSKRTFTKHMTKPAEARSQPGARPSTGSGATERKKLGLKFGG